MFSVLIGNAIKFTVHGKVTISAFIKTSRFGKNDKLIIEVKDSGVGID
jgi:signal transduction histidine kinase